jgi:chromosome segregation ATPase
MDGTVTQEDTEAMFSKIQSFMDFLRNALVNNTELAKQVHQMQQQLAELTTQINTAVGTNQALQEAVNVLTNERDEARRELQETQATLHDVKEKWNASTKEWEEKFISRDNDANHWYGQHQAVSEELAKVKEERSALEQEHQQLLEEHEKAKETLARIRATLGSVVPGFEPVAVKEVVKHEEPQPRDPVTQQWRSWNENTQKWEEKAAS